MKQVKVKSIKVLLPNGDSKIHVENEQEGSNGFTPIGISENYTPPSVKVKLTRTFDGKKEERDVEYHGLPYILTYSVKEVEEV